MSMTDFEKVERRKARQIMVFNASTAILEHLGTMDHRELVQMVHVACLGAVGDARAMFMVLRAKNIITEREEQFYLDQGYKAVLDQVMGHMNHKRVEEVRTNG
jgi:hypothetical protein